MKHFIFTLLLLLSFDASAKRIGIYAGTFDPFQLGHRSMAESAQQQLGLDEVIVLVNPSTPSKPNASPFHMRLQMTALGIEGLAHVNIMNQETMKVFAAKGYEGFLEDFSQKHSQDEIFSISGNDIILMLQKGDYRPVRLPNVKLAVAIRSGFDPELPVIPGVDMVKIEAKEEGLSSSLVRTAALRGSISHMVPQKVDAYIHQHELYGTASFCRQLFSPDR
jgi:nicotinate-nucleotide adenylyltransferase